MEKNLSFSVDQVQRVRIKLAWAQAEIVTGAPGEHQLFIAGDEESIDELRVEHTDGEVAVVQPQLSYAKEVLQRSRWLQICLRVPPEFQGDIDVDTVTGPIGANKISCGDVSLTTVSGSIRAKGIESHRASIHTVTGGITGENLRADRGSLRTVSGTATLEAASFGTVKAFTVSGGLNLSLAEGCRTLDIQSVSGGTRVEVQGPAKAVLHSIGGRLLLGEEVKSGPGCLEISASSVTGDLTVRGGKEE